MTLPTLSPKIPALPAGAPCARALYTLTTVPNIKIDYSAPEEGTALKDTLGLDDYLEVPTARGGIRRTPTLVGGHAKVMVETE